MRGSKMAKISDEDSLAMANLASLFAQRKDLRIEIQSAKARMDDVQAQIAAARAAIRRVADALDADPTA